MGAILASALIVKVQAILFDTNGVKWTPAELLGWINDGQREVCILDPNANNLTTAIALVAGSRQLVPTDGSMLLDIYRNMGSSGTTPGRGVRVVSKKLMDAFNPSWHTDAAATASQNFIYDPQDQRAFWVYPPSNGVGHLEINYAQVPADLTLVSQAIKINDQYANALENYMLYRAALKQTEFAAGQATAEAYFKMFIVAVKAKSDADDDNSPNKSLIKDGVQAEQGAET